MPKIHMTRLARSRYERDSIDKIKKLKKSVKELDREVESVGPDPIIDIENNIKRKEGGEIEETPAQNSTGSKAKQSQKKGEKRKLPSKDIQSLKKKKIEDSESEDTMSYHMDNENLKIGKNQPKKKAESSNRSYSEISSASFSISTSVSPPLKSNLSYVPQQKKKLSNARGRIIWTTEEEESLKRGVAVFGVGNWLAILNAYPFNERRNVVSLKDKWRNLVKKHSKSKLKVKRMR